MRPLSPEQLAPLVLIAPVILLATPALVGAWAGRRSSSSRWHNAGEGAWGAGIASVAAVCTGWGAAMSAWSCADIVRVAERGDAPEMLVPHLVATLAAIFGAYLAVMAVALLGGGLVGVFVVVATTRHSRTERHSLRRIFLRWTSSS
jgi:hypothetical protein